MNCMQFCVCFQRNFLFVLRKHFGHDKYNGDDSNRQQYDNYNTTMKASYTIRFHKIHFNAFLYEFELKHFRFILTSIYSKRISRRKFCGHLKSHLKNFNQTNPIRCHHIAKYEQHTFWKELSSSRNVKLKCNLDTNASWCYYYNCRCIHYHHHHRSHRPPLTSSRMTPAIALILCHCMQLECIEMVLRPKF